MRFLVFAAIGCALSMAATAAPQIDQDNIPADQAGNPYGYGATGSSYGDADSTFRTTQTFTVGRSGRLTGIEVAAFPVPELFRMTLRLFRPVDGVPRIADTPMVTTADLSVYNYFNYQYSTIQFGFGGGGVAVTAGDVLAYELFGPCCGSTLFLGNSYGGGNLFSYFKNYAYVPYPDFWTLENDFAFRTYVDEGLAAPVPAAGGLALLALAAAGLAASRLRLGAR